MARCTIKVSVINSAVNLQFIYKSRDMLNNDQIRFHNCRNFFKKTIANTWIKNLSFGPNFTARQK